MIRHLHILPPGGLLLFLLLAGTSRIIPFDVCASSGFVFHGLAAASDQALVTAVENSWIAPLPAPSVSEMDFSASGVAATGALQAGPSSACVGVLPGLEIVRPLYLIFLALLI
jgi:hypothetical protein